MTGTMKGRRKLLCQLRQTSKQREIRNREGCRGRQYKGLPNAAVYSGELLDFKYVSSSRTRSRRAMRRLPSEQRRDKGNSRPEQPPLARVPDKVRARGERGEDLVPVFLFQGGWW